jgi:hypothetical protein
LRFLQPIDVQLVLMFSIETQGLVVDLMLRGEAVYLQAGVPGDRLITSREADRVLVELPDGGFRAVWDKLFLERMTDVIAKRLAIRRRKARPKAEQLIDEMRRISGFRMPLKPSQPG